MMRLWRDMHSTFDLEFVKDDRERGVEVGEEAASDVAGDAPPLNRGDLARFVTGVVLLGGTTRYVKDRDACA